MGRQKKADRQMVKVDNARNAKIYTADSLLQKGRFELTLTEQRLILFAISHVRPADDTFKEYNFKISDFFAICGIKDESYTAIKKILESMRKKVWWILMEDPNAPGTECESLVSWFEVVRMNKNSGEVTIRFHMDMMPYLLQLARRWQDGEGFYTQMTLRYMLPMRSQYAVRLYQLLKAYQKNNEEYYFPIDDLKRLLDCQSYKDFKDFRVRVLEPAIRDINKFSDINVGWEATGKEGRRIVEVTFHMEAKDVTERLGAEMSGLTELDGRVHWWDAGAE